MPYSDLELMTRIGAGDHAAFETLYRRHIGEVTAYAVRRCRDAHEVAEVCAGVFISVWEGAATYDSSRGDVVTWMRGIAAHRFADLRRRDQRLERLRRRLREARVIEPADVSDLSERIDAAHVSSGLVVAMKRLPIAQRQAFVLVVVDGLTAGEAAEALGTTATAVRMRLSRARRSLRDQVAHASHSERPPSYEPKEPCNEQHL